ncbi:thiamine phosphate synthase [Cytophaga sp. FL35]|uniref:thiamine phosphate synthase n=1 Tax=Cytophaga sp. FL35 TaxID=1904456 RepID=UPI0016536558|nr:thiamine phosphate synthase [Cytophaga sp. FL35]MBC6998324.1 thiamine phosphate synthase [Cytophaga sp. FL35]
MIVLISPENDLPNELQILHQLFEEGLQFFHLRKPKRSRGDYEKYLSQLDEKFRNRIVVHEHYELLEKYDLRGIHFPERTRNQLIKNSKLDLNLKLTKSSEKIDCQIDKIRTMSTSFHGILEIKKCPMTFDYQFLSPVFTSISKENYTGKQFDVNSIPKKVIGLGGIDKSNIGQLQKLGYSGAALMGGIWKSSSPIADFKEMQQHF